MGQITKPVPQLASSQNGATPMITMSHTGSVASVAYNPKATIDGQNTNTRTLYLVNLGPDGGQAAPQGIVVIATLPLTAGTTITGHVDNTIPVTTFVSFATGDRITWASDATGTGLDDPGGSVTVTW